MTTPGLPSTGQLNWGTPLNDYILNETDPAGAGTQAVSNHVNASDPHGDRSYANQLTSGFTTNANKANGFVQLDNTGHIPATLAPTGGGISNFYDVKGNFGATGNGTTDDSAAINSALSGCASAGGGWVWVPAGTYAIASTLVIGSNTALVLVPGATIKRISSGGSTPAVMLANWTTSATTGAGNILVTGGTWQADSVSSNCTPMSFINGSTIAVRQTTIRGVQGSAGNPAVLTSGCSNVMLDAITLPGSAPTGSRSAYFAPAFDIESTSTSVITGLQSAMYSGHPACSNVTIRNCGLTGTTASDGNGNYTFYNYLAGTANPYSSSYHQNITVTGNTATGVASSAVQAANWQYTSIVNNSVDSYLLPFVNYTWTPSSPSITSQIQSGNNAADTYAFAQAYDSWHNFNPLVSGVSLASGGFAKYRLTPSNETQLSAWISCQNNWTSAPLTFTQITQTPLPAAYRPASNHSFPIGVSELAEFSANNSSGAIGQLASNGHIYIFGMSTFGGNVGFEVKIPLDI